MMRVFLTATTALILLTGQALGQTTPDNAKSASAENFFYNWSELSYAMRDWLRIGMVTQRTKVYQTDLDLQRGLLAGFSYRKVDFTAFLFNLGWTTPTLVMAAGYNF